MIAPTSTGLIQPTTEPYTDDRLSLYKPLPDTWPRDGLPIKEYDHLARLAPAVVYLHGGVPLPLRRAAIECIQERQPGAFLIMNDGRGARRKKCEAFATVFDWYCFGGHKAVTHLYIVTVGGVIDWSTEQLFYKSHATQTYILDPTTEKEGPRKVEVWSEYMAGRGRTITLPSIPIAAPLALPDGLRLATDAEVEAVGSYASWDNDTRGYVAKPALDRGPHDDIVCTEWLDDSGYRGYGIRNRLTGFININMWHPIGYHWRDNPWPSTPLLIQAGGKAARHG